MTLFLLTALTMVAFAANSLLTRAAIDIAGLDPLVFATIRVASGAAMLGLLVVMRGKACQPSNRWIVGAFWLGLYMVGFSLAYVTMDAGLGALILFGGVQITMFVAAIAGGDVISLRRWAGMGLAMVGLAWLMWPSAAAVVGLREAVLMLAGALGWGIYTLRGRAEADALGASAGNFLVCLPMVALVLVIQGGGAMPWSGVALASVSGAITSGLGYALWYRILPQLDRVTASVAQLSAPVIAVIGGAVLLGERVTLPVLIAGVLVLGGIALAVIQPRPSQP